MPARAAFFLLAGACCAAAQTPAHQHDSDAAVPLQPLAQQVRRLEDAMNYLGQPFPAADHEAINAAIATADAGAAVAELEKILDRYALAIVDINAESRVKVEPGPAKPELVEGGTRLFLVKVINRANVTAALRVASPNSGNVYIQSTGNPEPKLELTPQNAADRWAEISIYDKPPMDRRLSGLALDYRILEIYSRDSGQRSAQISFNVGQGSQDIGFRNDILVLCNALPAHVVKLRVRDEKGRPAMASFVIRDRLNRLYPSPSKRLAPDFFFQPQIYRADGESISLPAGYYNITYTGGPEYRVHTKEFAVDDKGPSELAFQLERWIDPASYGWYSGDHHVHAAGCSHYQNPTEGVLPQDMIRQISGEGLNIGSVLTWGPDYYYQKQFFSGHDDPLSKADELMHYDLEVSGFPSSHAGHIVLLGLREQDYPGATRISDWPTWDLPIFRWAKAQGAVVGFAHSGWGLEVMSDDLPNYEMPGFDGIGANEYIVDVTEPGLVDFISSVDTPYVWELSIWYHTLNVGFRTRIAGETDFPCIYDQRVGIGRTYTKLDNLSYTNWMQALKAGRSYVSDGKSHLMDFKLNDTPVGIGASEVRLGAPGSVHAQVNVSAYLDSLPDQSIRGKRYNEKPYWDVERARIGDTREVPVELVVNGQAVARKNVAADGQVREVAFDAAIEKSSWVAVRILPSAHTNPIFVLVGGKPVRASRRSAEWCLAAVSQCWTQKAPRISVAELGAARQAYDRAREVYKKLLSESE
ncbi:MAG TPA: CehA/McbA family metallohydrolase [Bryobacteraceae bacterium]|jgi:hypothetical protein|nr:CehA/McbA family metallohydrolase [Bryobacteraceae bacterium]